MNLKSTVSASGFDTQNSTEVSADKAGKILPASHPTSRKASVWRWIPAVAVGLCFLLETASAQCLPGTFILKNQGASSTIGLDIYFDDVKFHSVYWLASKEKVQLALPTSFCSAGTHKIKVVETYSSSVTKLAPFRMIFEPNVVNTANGTHVIYDSLTQNRLWAEYTVQSQARTDSLWGALVYAELPDGTFYDRLVGVYDGQVAFSGDVEVSTAGLVAVKTTHPITQDSTSTIWIYGDDSKGNALYYAAYPEAPISFSTVDVWHTTISPDKGIFSGSSGPGTVLYQAGTWYFSKVSKPTVFTLTPVNRSVAYLYALYRTKGPHYDPVSNVRPLLLGMSKQKCIPPLVSFAVAYRESYPRWQQFRNEPESPSDPSSGPWTILSADGGIGLMQLTGSTALEEGTPRAVVTGQAALQRLARLASDVSFNIGEGVEVLNSKWDISKSKGRVVGNHDRRIIEEWFYAVWYYNGYHPGVGFSVYPAGVINLIRTAPKSFWQSTPISLPDQADESAKQQIPYTPTPAHVDPDFTGEPADLVVINADLRLAFDRVATGTDTESLRFYLTNTTAKLVNGGEVKLALGGVSVLNSKITTVSGKTFEATSPGVCNVLLAPDEKLSFDSSFPTTEAVSAAECQFTNFSGGLGIAKRTFNAPATISGLAPNGGSSPTFTHNAFAMLSRSLKVAPGEVLSVGGTLTNDSSQFLYLNEVSVNVDSSDIRVSGLNFLANSPPSLAPFSSWSGQALDVSISPDIKDGLYKATMTVYGGTTPSSADLIGQQDVILQVGYLVGGVLTLSLAPLPDRSLSLEWTGGFPPFQVQTSTTAVVGSWTDLAPPATNGTYRITPTNPSGFFRVRYQEEP